MNGSQGIQKKRQTVINRHKVCAFQNENIKESPGRWHLNAFKYMLPNKIDLMIKLPIIHNRHHKVEVMHKKSIAILEIQGTLEKFATLKFIYVF